MKTISISLVLLISLFTNVHAQDSDYQRAMGEALDELAQAKSAGQLQSLANSFERIANQASTEFHPHYYAAFVLINSSFSLNEAKERDQIIDKAFTHVEKAEALNPGNDEIEVLRGYALMAKMVVDPMARAQQYSPRIMQSFGKAMAMNPENPRAAAMMARQELGTSQFFGTEPVKACSLAQQSLSLFEKEQPQGFNPRWGRDLALEVSLACKK